MHDAETSHEIKKSNGTLKTTKIKKSATPVDRREFCITWCGWFFNLLEL